MSRAATCLAALALVLGVTAGCVPRTTTSTQVGVRVNKITGVEERVYEPGGTYMFLPLINEWYVFPTSTQLLEMIQDPAKGDRQGRDDVEFKTRDGNDVAVDIKVLYHINREKVVHILTHVARSPEELKEIIIRPLARTIPRDELNVLTSEDIYTLKKFAAAKAATERLRLALEPYGVVVEDVNLVDHRFHADYQRTINDKKVFDQQANTNRSAAENTLREWQANLENTRGDVEQAIAAQQGELARAKLEADAYYYSMQKSAEAMLAEKEAQAKGIRKLREAMAGSGGRTRIKMRLAEALKGKRIIVVPNGGNGAVNINKLDINELLRARVAQEAK